MNTHNHLQQLEELLEEIEWFSNLPPQLNVKTRHSISKAIEEKKIFWTPPKEITLDLECGPDNRLHTRLLTKFADASYGIFTPTDINETHEIHLHEGIVHFSFRCNSKNYSISMPHNGDWVCPQFFELLDQTMDDTGSGLRFIDLNGSQEQIGEYILCNPQAYYKATQLGLVSSTRYILWSDGDVLSYRLRSGFFVLFLVVGSEQVQESWGPICALFDWSGQSVPLESHIVKFSIQKKGNDQLMLFFITQPMGDQLPKERLELVAQDVWEPLMSHQILKLDPKELIVVDWQNLDFQLKNLCNLE
jgi:hypothetical protein